LIASPLFRFQKDHHMFIKLTEKGWTSYNGDLGTVLFVDGVSTQEVTRQEALRLGAFITVMEIDADGNELGQVSPALDTLRSTKVTVQPQAGLARVQSKPTISEEVENLTDTVNVEPIAEARAKQHAAEAAGRAHAEAVAAESRKVVHTPESLSAIASAKGIAGLREVAPAGVKNTSIKGLMAEILAAQDAGN
jgi:hypothetical protein